jgi:alpha-tubulin suppressor-like RCC1 family protein
MGRILVAAAVSLLVLVLAPPARAQALSVWGDVDAFANPPTPTPAGDFGSLARGGAFQGLAIRTDGTLALWGGVNDRFAVPEIPATLRDQTFRAASLGRYLATAIRSDGTAVSWARTDLGIDMSVPSRLASVRMKAVACGRAFTIGLGLDGLLYGWGDNATDQLAVPPGRFKAVAARNYSLGLRADGKLFGWGKPDDGVPVFDGWISESLPGPGGGALMSAHGRYKAIAAGNIHVVALRVDGTIAAFGVADDGELDVPAGSDFVDVAAGYGISVALRNDGTLVGWGAVPPSWPFGHHVFDTWTPDGAGHFVAPGRYQAITAGAFHIAAISAPDRDDDDGDDHD